MLFGTYGKTRKTSVSKPNAHAKYGKLVNVHVLVLRLACQQALPLKMARGQNIGAWLLISKLVTKPLYFDRVPFQRKSLLAGYPPISLPVVVHGSKNVPCEEKCSMPCLFLFLISKNRDNRRRYG